MAAPLSNLRLTELPLAREMFTVRCRVAPGVLLADREPIRAEDRAIVRNPAVFLQNAGYKEVNGEHLAVVLNNPTAGEPNAYVELTVIVQQEPTVLSERGWCRPWQIVEMLHQAPTVRPEE